MLFGRYYYSDNADMRPIEWFPIDETEDAILYIAKYCIEMKLYSIDEPNGPRLPEWSESTIRKWLNSEFLSVAFTTEEQRSILPVEHENTQEDGIFGCIATVTDRIFLLSKNEVLQYLFDRSIRKTELTPYAASKREYPDDPWWWWTRTSGSVEYDGATIHFVGVACAIPDDEETFPFPNVQETWICDEVNAVRPAFWMRKGGPMQS